MYCTDVQIRRSRQSAVSLDRQNRALKRRFDEAEKGSQRAMEQYTQSCAQFGSTGEHIEHDLACAIAKLPLELEVVWSYLQHQDFHVAVDAYSSFASAGDESNLEKLHEFLFTPSDAPLPSRPHVLHGLHERMLETSCSTCMGLNEDVTQVAAPPEAGILGNDVSFCNGDTPVTETHCYSEAEDWNSHPRSRLTSPAWDITIAATGNGAMQGVEKIQSMDQKPMQTLPCSGNDIHVCNGHPAVQRLAFDADFRSELVAEMHEVHGYLMRCRHEQELVSAIPGFLPDQVHFIGYDHVSKALDCLNSAIGTLQQPHILMILRAAGSSAFRRRFISKLHMHLTQVWICTGSTETRGLHCCWSKIVEVQSQSLKARVVDIQREQDKVRAMISQLGHFQKKQIHYLEVACQQLQSAVAAATGVPVLIAHGCF